MAKRFTDTEKYKDPWFRNLKPELKILFMFMCDDCNHAGVWKENFFLFNIYYNLSLTHDDMAGFDDRVICISPDTYFLKNFIKFQYGELNPNNNAHRGVIKSLKYNNLQTRGYVAPRQPLPRGYVG